MSFSKRILIGLAAGILVGLFLGDRASALKWAADGFVKLLQMTVLPYLTVSIVGSLGRLQYDQARRLGVRTGLVIAGLWAVAVIFTFLIPLAFPQVENASFFSSSLVEHQLQCNPQLGRQTVGELDVVPNQLSTAFVMRDSARDRFTSWEDVRSMPAVTLAVPDVPYYIEKLEQLAPRASIQTITSISATLESFPPGVDAVAFPAERGSAWTLIFPAYSVVVPARHREDPARLPDRPARPGLRDLCEHLDRSEKEGRHARCRVPLLDPRSELLGAPGALVDHP